jgi:hypothetical protein
MATILKPKSKSPFTKNPSISPRVNPGAMGKEQGLKSGGWISKVSKSIKARGTKGKCTPISKKGCSGKAKTLALTFKKIARNRKKK